MVSAVAVLNLTFAISSYVYDRDMAGKTIEDLRRVYPQAGIVHLLDDPPNRLKLPQFAGRWTERWMLSALATPADIVIKVDPDTIVCRPLEDFPSADMFGAFSQRQRFKGIMGGAVGFQRSAVQQIVDSKFLLDKKYTESLYAFGEYRPGRDQTEIMSLQDPIVFDVALRLGLTTSPWSDVHMYRATYEMPKVDHSKYGFVHE